jgi:hypothetical protein
MFLVFLRVFVSQWLDRSNHEDMKKHQEFSFRMAISGGRTSSIPGRRWKSSLLFFHSIRDTHAAVDARNQLFDGRNPTEQLG